MLDHINHDTAQAVGKALTPLGLGTLGATNLFAYMGAVPLAVAGLVWATMPATDDAPLPRCGVGGACEVCTGPNLGPTWNPGERPFDPWAASGSADS